MTQFRSFLRDWTCNVDDVAVDKQELPPGTTDCFVRTPFWKLDIGFILLEIPVTLIKLFFKVIMVSAGEITLEHYIRFGDWPLSGWLDELCCLFFVAKCHFNLPSDEGQYLCSSTLTCSDNPSVAKSVMCVVVLPPRSRSCLHVYTCWMDVLFTFLWGEKCLLRAVNGGQIPKHCLWTAGLYLYVQAGIDVILDADDQRLSTAPPVEDSRYASLRFIAVPRTRVSRMI